MKPSQLSRLLFCLLLCGSLLSGLARGESPAEKDPLLKLRKEGWKIVQDGVLQRELRSNEIETFVFGEAGFSWKLRDLQAQFQILRKEFQAHPTPELRKAIASHRKLIASTVGMIERARTAEASGEPTAFEAGCTPSFTYKVDASYSTDHQGTWANAAAGFKVSPDCGASGEVYAFVSTKTTVDGLTSTSIVTDGPRSGLNVKAHAHAKRYGGGSPCGSYAYAAVTSNGLNPTSYSVARTNDWCPTTNSENSGVTVVPVDESPTAVSDTATVTEDSGVNAIPVLANDTDPDGGPISIASVTQPANGTVVITGGGTGLAYTPNANYCNNPPGTTLDTFTYTLTPGGSSATVSITVTCVDDRPTAVNNAATVTEGTSNNVINVLANDTDPDAGPKSVSSVTQPANGLVTITGGGTGVAYTPNANYCNNPPGTTLDTFTYTLTPGGSSATVAVTVTCVDDNPVAVADVVTVNEDSGANAIDVLANDTDADGGARSIQSVTQPANGSVVITGGGTGLTYTPNANYCNNPPGTTSDTFTYTLTPGGSSATVSVTVTCVDDNPTAVNDSAVMVEDSGANAISVLANDTDPDGGSISIASVMQPANGTVVITGGGTGLAYSPNANYCNNPPGATLDTFTYTLTPGGSTATVTMTVTCLDDNPVAVADSATVAEDSGSNAFNVLANDTDPDGGPISITSVTQPANGTVIITGGGTGLAYSPNANYCNNPPGTTLDIFTYTLTPGGSSATVSVIVTCVDDNPVAVADLATVVEDSGANAFNVLANDTDADGGAKSITSVTQPANGTVVITSGGTGLAYTPNANYCNYPPGTAPDTFTYTLTPGGSTATVSVAVTCVDDNPVAVNDSAVVAENSGANAIPVLTNDTDIDAGPKSIASVTQPANGTVVITGGGTGLTYAPNVSYCNNPPGAAFDTFTYTLTPGGSSATVTMTVVCINNPPVADNDSFDFIGNTDLVVDQPALATPHTRATTPSTFGVLDGDSDPVEGNAIAVTSITVGACTDSSAPFDCTDPAVGRVQMQSNGRFIFTPAPGDTGATETFQYTVTDDGGPPASTTATVTLTRFARVWYVKNDALAGGLGRSSDPFDTLAEAETASLAGDTIYVYFGDGTTVGQDAGIALKANQSLIGEGVQLAVPVSVNGGPSPTVLRVAGSRPLLDRTGGTGDGVRVANVTGVEIRGLNLAGIINAIDVTTTAGGSAGAIIANNSIRSAGAEGIDVNAGGTGTMTLSILDNALTSTGTAIDIARTAGTVVITGFANNSVSGNTSGSGIVITGPVTFDSNTATAGNQAVFGGNTVIGVSGNGVGGAGLVMNGVTGTLVFADLDIFADGGAGLRAAGTGAFTFQVGAGVSIIEATGGPAVDVAAAAIDLQLASLKSTNSATTGVSLDTVTGTFSAGAGSSITNSTGTDFNINAGTANVTYSGTITDDIGPLVSVSGATAGIKSFEGAITDGDDGDGGGIALNGNTGATIRFSGGLTLSTGANPAFAATGGGIVEVCDENPCNQAATGFLVNKLTTTTGTALNVANTTIGVNDLEFRSISADGAPNGIILNNTGSVGELNLTGNSGAGTGGTIQNTTGDGIVLISTKTPSFRFLNVLNTGGHGINASGMTAGLTLTNCQITGAGDGDNEHGLRVSNVGGTIAVNGSTLTDAEESLIDVDNTNTNLTLNLGTAAANTFTHNALGPFTGNGIQIVGRGSTSYTVSVAGSQFTNVNLFAVQVSGDATSTGTHTITLDNNGFGVTIPGRTNAVDVQGWNTSNVILTATNNFLNGAGGGSIRVAANNSSIVRATLSANTITNTRAEGILATVDQSAKLRLLITNNQISNTSSDGIKIRNLDSDGGVGSELDAVVTGNTVSGHNNNSGGNASRAGIGVSSFGGPACVKVAGNNVQGTPSPGVTFFDYSLRELGGTMIFEENPNTKATVVTTDYILDGGSPDTVDTTPPNVGGSRTLDLAGTIDLSNGAIVCDRP